MVRTPPEGGLKSNVGYLGHYFLISPDDFPDEPRKIAEEIDTENFARFEDRLYSIDFLRGNDSVWYVVEGNARPILLARQDGDNVDTFMDALADKLIQMAERDHDK